MDRIQNLQPHGKEGLGQPRPFKNTVTGEISNFPRETFGWSWDIVCGDGSTESYRTNAEGDGLWKWAPSTTAYYTYEWHQIKGTCQFSVRSREDTAKERARVRRYIRRELSLADSATPAYA